MQQVTLNNDFLRLTTLNYGAIIQKLMVVGKDGKETNVVVGFENPEDYLKDTFSLGACIGRYAGRISNGGFHLNGRRYELYQQDGVHLHGGKQGLGKRYWNLLEVHEGTDPFVRYQYESPEMEEGYPGNLKVTVTYQLLKNTLKIIHEATTDRATVVNLTNHSYFKLDGAPTVEQLQLKLHSSSFLETDHKLLPTGRILPVEDSPYDFSTKKAIGKLHLDTPFCIGPSKEAIAEVSSPSSGLRLRVFTNQPAVVVFTPSVFPAICFETQNYPDAPTFAHFPSALLRPGETYHNESDFVFDLVP